MSRKTADGRKALKKGEYQRPNGTFQYKWREGGGYKQVSAATLDELREKETEVMRNRLDGIKGGHGKDTLNDWYEVWKTTKTIRTTTMSNFDFSLEYYCVLFDCSVY